MPPGTGESEGKILPVPEVSQRALCACLASTNEIFSSYSDMVQECKFYKSRTGYWAQCLVRAVVPLRDQPSADPGKADAVGAYKDLREALEPWLHRSTCQKHFDYMGSLPGHQDFASGLAVGLRDLGAGRWKHGTRAVVFGGICPGLGQPAYAPRGSLSCSYAGRIKGQGLRKFRTRRFLFALPLEVFLHLTLPFILSVSKTWGENGTARP